MEESVEPLSQKGVEQKMASAITTPQVSKGRKVEVKRIKKKVDLSTSRVQKTAATPKTFRNFGFHNMSIQKQTLRANNKALAQDLARTRQELRVNTNALNKLKSENQELIVDLNRLKRLVGSTDEQIEEEVKKRMKEQVTGMYDIVEDLVQNVFHTGKYLTDLREKFIEFRRRTSTCPDRTSYESTRGSLERSTDEDSAKEKRTSLGELNRQRGSQLAKNLCLADGLRPVVSSSSVSRHADISVIAEQSFLGEGEEEALAPLPLVMETVPETITALPQRVKRSELPKKKVQKSNESGKSRTANTADDSHSDLFGFGDTDIELVSGSPIKDTSIQTNESKTRQTSAVPAIVISSTDKPENVTKPTQSKSSKKVVVETEKRDESRKKRMLPADKNKTSAKLSNTKKPEKAVSKKVSSPSKAKRKDLNETENPFVPKTTKVIRSPVKLNKNSEPAAGDSSTIDPFKPKKNLSRSPVKQSPNDPFDPFRPSRTLLRSPVAMKTSKPAVVNENPIKKIGSQEFFARLSANLENNRETEPLPEPDIADESTVFFNSDMELTRAIDIPKIMKQKSPVMPTIQAEKEPAPKSKHLHDEDQAKSQNTAKNVHGKKQTKSVEKPDNVEEASDDNIVAPVEMRNLKPGIFTFNVSRKEADGSRKPVPEKTSRARSKKKPNVMEEEERRETEDRDLFNFGDRTPTMPIEKVAKQNKCVYDMSMNDSVAAQKLSLNSYCEKMKDTNVIPSNKEKRKEDENIYYLPLKGCSDDLPTEKRSRSRSKKRNDSNDEEWVPGQRSKSRSRSKSKNKAEETENDVAMDQRKSRSRSRKRSKSGDEESSPEKIVRRSNRSRSRPRIVVNSDDEGSPEKIVRCSNRSRSRPRIVVNTDDEGSPEKIVRRSNRSRSRPRIVVNSDDEKDKSDQKSNQTSSASNEVKTARATERSKSRSRKGVESDYELLEADDACRSRSRSKEHKGTFNEPVRRSARSQSRPRKALETENEDLSSASKDKSSDVEKQTFEKATAIMSVRSKARHMQVIESEDGENLADAKKVERSRSRSAESHKEVKEPMKRLARSRQRKVIDSDKEESLQDTKDVRRSRSRSVESLVTANKHISSRRSRSRTRKETGSDLSPPAAISRKSADYLNIGNRKAARSRSRRRKEIDSEDEDSAVKVSNERKGGHRSRSRSVEKEVISEPSRRSTRTKTKPVVYTFDDTIDISSSPLSDKQKDSRTSDMVTEVNMDKNIASEGSTINQQARQSSDGQDKVKEKVASELVNKTNGKDVSETILDPHIYHLPLKGSPADTKSKTSKSTKSRSRSRNRASASEGNDNSDKSASRSKKRKIDSQQDEKEDIERDRGEKISDGKSESRSTGLVLPMFNIVNESPARPISDCEGKQEDFLVSNEDMVLKERSSSVKLDNNSAITKRSRRKTAENKTSTKTPKVDSDFKMPNAKSTRSKKASTVKSVKTKSSSKSRKKTDAQSTDDICTPRAEHEYPEPTSTNVTRKRLDQAFEDGVEMVDSDSSPRPSSRKPKSTTKQSGKKRDGDKSAAGTPKGKTKSKAKEVIDDENAVPLNNFATLKKKLSMLTSKSRQSVTEKDERLSGVRPLATIQPTSNAPAEENDESEKRRRRNTGAVSYVVSLKGKLRREDQLSKENAEKARLLLAKKMPIPKET